MVDIGIVLLPSMECENLARYMSEMSQQELPGFVMAKNNPHITMIHIANLDEEGVKQINRKFDEFYHKHRNTCIDLPIKNPGITATGGNEQDGYKWLDLQFETLKELAILRQDAVDSFCPFHNGMLRRMYDDYANFNQQQLADIEKCGVTYSNYLPHITAWYIDLPNEEKTTKLAKIALSLQEQIEELHCYVTSVAMVELGRNGNAMQILNSYPLCVSGDVVTEAEL